MRPVVIGLALGIASSAWMVVAARDHRLAAALPHPLVTACLGLGVIGVGWVVTQVAPRFAAALAGAAAPGAVYAAFVLAGDGPKQLAYGWSAVPVALGCLALGAGLHSSHSPSRPWSARRSTASRLPRVRLR